MADIQLRTRMPPWQIFLVFLRLGTTSFGGPIAHLGYFREEFVVRRKWLDETTFANIVGLCQSLPGPASSQTGFAIGLLKGGALGALAAWIAFTLPSAFLMTAFAYGYKLLAARGSGVLHGLELVAVAVVAQAVWGMMRSLAPDRKRATIAILSAWIVLLLNSAASQILTIALGALAGFFLCREDHGRAVQLDFPIRRWASITSLLLFALLLLLPPIIFQIQSFQSLAIFHTFYRAGALVFGGGHVVLPVLQPLTVGRGWIDNDVFLAGYGAAQALPGPLFAFAAYLGASVRPGPHGIAGALIALIAIFLPGLLLVVAVLPFWNSIRRNQRTQGIFAGINASVAGILLAALYTPVWTSAVHAPLDFAIALGAFLVLAIWKVQPWIVVLATASTAALLGKFF